MNNVIFTNFGDNDSSCCDIGDILVQCDNPAKVEAEWKEAEKYKWHDLRKNPNDLPEEADDSKSGYSKEVLIISSLFNEVLLGYMKLSDKKWFDSVDGELLSKPVMWKYIELPDEKSVSKEGE